MSPRSRSRSAKLNLASSSYASKPNLKANVFPTDPDFTALVQKIEAAIEKGVDPKLITQGSSGSYFVPNEEGEILAIFKPKDEEPFADRNPKWPKWFQRHLSPCCFGRSCLLTNFGYLSETAASVVDERLGFFVVPKTRVVRLASKSFCYKTGDRKKKTLPPKIGSLQTFVKDFKDARYWLRGWEAKDPPLHSDISKTFLILFQKMIILDYVIRNTGFSAQISVYENGPTEKRNLVEEEKGKLPNAEAEYRPPSVEIAVIDNGLAFPHKHPDSWRIYPFYWASSPYAKEPFSEEVTELIGAKFKSPLFVEKLCEELKSLFMIDSNFYTKVFWRQMSVMRGQIANVRRALAKGPTINYVMSLIRLEAGLRGLN